MGMDVQAAVGVIPLKIALQHRLGVVAAMFNRFGAA
jgi:hypothetical protein